MPVKLADFQDLVSQVEVLAVRPQHLSRQLNGAQWVQVRLKLERNRYTAAFYKTMVKGKETIKTGDTFVNGALFNEFGEKTRIPQVPFAALARRAAAVLNEKFPNPAPLEANRGKPDKKEEVPQSGQQELLPLRP